MFAAALPRMNEFEPVIGSVLTIGCRLRAGTREAIIGTRNLHRLPNDGGTPTPVRRCLEYLAGYAKRIQSPWVSCIE